MKQLLLSLLGVGLACQLSFAQTTEISSKENITRILNTLASDDMRGRSSLSVPDIEKAADFIASEFKSIGLKPYSEANYRQSFKVLRKKQGEESVELDGKALKP